MGHIVWLFDHEITAVALDDRLDIGNLVRRRHDEKAWLLPDRGVLLGRHVDPHQATTVRALADEAAAALALPLGLCRLVYLAEPDLVLGQSFLPGRHRSSLDPD